MEPMNHTAANLNRTAWAATLHCLTGCAIGEVLGMVLGTWLGWGNGVTIVVQAGRGSRARVGHRVDSRDGSRG
jgi:uncharacterized protein YcfJ